MPIECERAFQRLFLLSFGMKKKTYQRSEWISHNEVSCYLVYDPLRQRRGVAGGGGVIVDRASPPPP
jgi:hypothetical protein